MGFNLYPIHHETTAQDYFEGARAAAAYVRSFAVKGDKGVFWRKEADEEPQIDFYHGSAGIIVFFLQLAKASGDDAYLQDAREGGDYILHELRRVNYDYPIKCNFSDYAPYRNNRATFYAGGFAGVAFSLIELSKALSVPAYEEAALILTEKIAADAKPVDFGVIWTGYSGPYHDGGTILYLLYAARHFNRPEWKELAAQGGRAIISTGETYGADQVWYKGFHNILAEFNGKDPEKESDFFPNFSYGTSGMTYVLARLYEETGDRDFLEAAEKGANYLISIAVPASQGRLIPYHYPDNREDVFFLGLCHGPVGSSRVFVLLHRLTKNPIYRDFYVELTQGIIGAGAPEYHSAGYWDCHCQCCGTAGFVNLFLGIWLESGGDEYLDYAVRSGKVLLGGATYDGEKAIWYQAFTRLKPDLITTDLGYMEGAAGIGVALLQLSTALGEDFTTIRLPDDPFATAGHRA